MLMSLACVAALAVGTSMEARPPWPFFAMDTCLKPAYPASTMTLDEQLDLVKSLGYAGLSWTEGDPAELRAVVEGSKKRGLKLYAHYAAATLRKSGLETNPRLPETVRALAGSGSVLWPHVGSPDFRPSDPAGDAAAIEGLRRIADLAAASNVKVALYPHVAEWVERVQDAVRLARAVGKRDFGVTFNLCHCLKMGYEARIPDLLAEAKPHLMIVTLNGADSDASQAGWDRLIQTLDRGTYDTGALLSTLQKLRYRGPIGLQGYGIGGDTKENLTRSMAAWQKLGH